MVPWNESAFQVLFAIAPRVAAPCPKWRIVLELSLISNLYEECGAIVPTPTLPVGNAVNAVPPTPTSTKDSISLESSKSAVVEQGKVVSGDMSQAKADYTNKKLELVKYRQQLITRHGYDSDEVKEIKGIVDNSNDFKAEENGNYKFNIGDLVEVVSINGKTRVSPAISG